MKFGDNQATSKDRNRYQHDNTQAHRNEGRNGLGDPAQQNKEEGYQGQQRRHQKVQDIIFHHQIHYPN